MVSWAKIISIQSGGQAAVYDLEVFPGHNFIASGVVVHNCNFRCQFCAAAYQTGVKASIPIDHAQAMLEDAAEIGVRGMVTMSDGESLLNPYWPEFIRLGKRLGLDMAAATNGSLFTADLAEKTLSSLTYLRFNVSAGEPGRYAEIMGVSAQMFKRVMENIRQAVYIKRRDKLPVTLNISMVLHPDFADQVLPFARLGKELGVDYAIIKHCLDYTGRPLGVDYARYQAMDGLIQAAEALSTPDYLVTAKRRMMGAGASKSCDRCYAPLFLLQVSGSGLLGACGPLFAPQYAKKFHIGNVCETRLIDLWRSARYREVMDYLRSPEFTDTRPCASYLCVQRHTNEALDRHLKGERLVEPPGEKPAHLSFL